MLLMGYTKRIFRAECNPSFESLHCIADLDQDITEVLPYLNASLGGFTYVQDPPSVTFRVHGKLITVYGKQIAVNALKDEEEADKILNWLKGEINEVWEKRGQIRPSQESAPRPQIIEILKLLPRPKGCRACGQPSCIVLAQQIAEGAKGPEACLPMTEENRQRLREYLAHFRFPQF
jgi:ArsR family metal-binding transcriptional regulator